MTTLTKDNRIFRNGAPYKILRSVSGAVQLENEVTCAIDTLPLYTLLEEYGRGIVKVTLAKTPRRLASDPSIISAAAIARMSEPARIETRRHVDFVIKLVDRGVLDSTSAALQTAITEISRERGDNYPPHITTVYRWIKVFREAQNDVRALLSRMDLRGGKNRSRLAPAVDAIIAERINQVYLTSKSCSAEAVHEAVGRAIRIENAKRIESDWLKIPGLRTIQRRISNVYAFDIAVAKFGLKEAERRYGFVGKSRPVSRILELVEIDHTPVDILVVDEWRIPCARPVVTFIIDRFSRCILGYHLSAAGHGAPAVFEALRHALLPKTYIKNAYPDLNMEWECFGWFERLLMDNAPEFHSDSVADASISIGIAPEFSESREPNDKAFIERLNNTFNYSFIHQLPGTTLAKLHKRVGFKAEDTACITLAELDKLIHAWILGHYHLRPHAGLNGRAPIDVWRESAAKHPPLLKENAERLEIEFAETTSSAVQHYGIDLNNYQYASIRLSNLRRMLPVKAARVDVKWPRHNLGHIHVWDPFNKEYFMVPNTDPGLEGITLEQDVAVRKFKKSDDSYDQVRADTSELVRQIVEKAASDKKLKSRKQAARLANKTSKTARQPAAEKVPDEVVDVVAPEESDSDVMGFPIEPMHNEEEN